MSMGLSALAIFPTDWRSGAANWSGIMLIPGMRFFAKGATAGRITALAAVSVPIRLKKLWRAGRDL